MVHAKGEERAVNLAREAVELVDAGHREVGDLFLEHSSMETSGILICSYNRLLPGILEKPLRSPPKILK